MIPESMRVSPAAIPKDPVVIATVRGFTAIAPEGSRTSAARMMATLTMAQMIPAVNFSGKSYSNPYPCVWYGAS